MLTMYCVHDAALKEICIHRDYLFTSTTCVSQFEAYIFNCTHTQFGSVSLVFRPGVSCDRSRTVFV